MAIKNAMLTISREHSTIKRLVTVVQYSVGYTSTMNQATVRDQVHSYPIQVRENDFQFSLQCHSVERFEQLVEDFHSAQRAAYPSLKRGMVHFSYPALGLDYTGYPTIIGAGVRRFEIAPTLTISMTLIKDNINRRIRQYSTLDGRWSDVVGTSVVDLYNKNIAKSIMDSILGDSRPHTSKNSGVMNFQ